MQVKNERGGMAWLWGEKKGQTETSEQTYKKRKDNAVKSLTQAFQDFQFIKFDGTQSERSKNARFFRDQITPFILKIAPWISGTSGSDTGIAFREELQSQGILSANLDCTDIRFYVLQPDPKEGLEQIVDDASAFALLEKRIMAAKNAADEKSHSAAASAHSRYLEEGPNAAPSGPSV
jgi:hypothetical protein